MSLADITICTFLQPLVEIWQLALSVAWTPFSLFGLTVPSVADLFSPLLSCTLG